MITTRGGSVFIAGSTAAGAHAPGAGGFSASDRVAAVLARSLGISPTKGFSVLPLVGSSHLNRLREHWGEAALAELSSLAREGDRELFYEALLGLGQRLEAQGRLEVAVELYAAVVLEAGLVGAGHVQPLRIRAQNALDAIAGRGAIGPRAEFLLRNFAQQTSDPTMLFAMGTAGAVFRMTRMAALSRLVGTSNAGFMTQFLGAGRLASLAGFVAEGAVFPLAARLGNEALGRAQDWGANALGRDLASSYLLLGGLRFAGWAVGTAHRGLATAVGAGHVQPLRMLFQQGGMLSGILLGHAVEERLGLRQPQGGATTLLDSLALLLQFNVAGRFARQAFGPRFAAWEARMDLQAEALASAGPSLPGGPFGRGGIFALQPALQTAGAAGAPIPGPLGPNVLMMTGRGRGGGSRPTLPVEAKFHLTQVESENSATALASTARLQDMLRTGEGLSSREYVEIFRQLYRKIDANIEIEAHDLIVNGLNELLSQMNVREPGPRALFREMTRPDLAEELITPGFYASWMKNPSLTRSSRRRVADLVINILQRHDLETELPHDQALTLLVQVWNLPQLERSTFRALVEEAVRFSARESSWALRFEHIEELSTNMLSDRRVPERQQEQWLAMLRSGLRDTNLRSQTRVHILEHLEVLALKPGTAAVPREWLRFHLPMLRDQFLKENLEEVRQYGERITNFAELGYLLSRDYVNPDIKVLLAQEMLKVFQDYPSSSMGYDHLVTVAHSYALHPQVPSEARFPLWAILCKATWDWGPEFSRGGGASRRIEQWARLLPATLAATPAAERRTFAQVWIFRLQRGQPQQRLFASQILEALSPYLTPNFDLRQRLEAAGDGNLLEIQAAVRRVFSRWEQLN